MMSVLFLGQNFTKYIVVREGSFEVPLHFRHGNIVVIGISLM
jgi:hypothetical protein